MARCLKNEIGRCAYCGSSIVTGEKSVAIGGVKTKTYFAVCCDKACGHRTAGTLIRADVPAMARSWGLARQKDEVGNAAVPI